jgi:hypothetical protein
MIKRMTQTNNISPLTISMSRFFGSGSGEGLPEGPSALWVSRASAESMSMDERSRSPVDGDLVDLRDFFVNVFSLFVLWQTLSQHALKD